jgi:hypothetical protein
MGSLASIERSSDGSALERLRVYLGELRERRPFPPADYTIGQ